MPSHLLFLFFLLFYTACTKQHTVMKAAGSNSGSKDGCHSIDAINSTWWYNWRPFPTPCNHTSPSGRASFIPMVWGKENIKDIPHIDRSADALLGFNEPNAAHQSNLTAKEAASLWHHLEATGMRLGSPAPGTGNYKKSTEWLDEFFHFCKGCRVDFIAMHWYAEAFSHNSSAGCTKKELFEFIRFWADRYKKPIWLTEFSCIKSSAAANLEFQRTTLPFMAQASPMLERYSWFAIHPQKDKPIWDAVALVELKKPTKLTRLGNFFETL
eukprot:TRINITY_DN54287_c0_g1_i1.p1 TRINITY_DN54287_c0_g1~~TRINITY_DN54287_c0_g1_i1.p1  ORF type:complete len:269 (+),score=20.08 TRINITY_DN54287_c0_g1_i1:13-819(+)